jgi:hypothetical protein
MVELLDLVLERLDKNMTQMSILSPHPTDTEGPSVVGDFHPTLPSSYAQRVFLNFFRFSLPCKIVSTSVFIALV